MIKFISLHKIQFFIGLILIAIFSDSYSQDEIKQKVVAIFPFHFASTDHAQKEAIAELNGLFYDLFAGQFINTGYFEVVDRQNIQDLIGEISLQQTGLTESQVVSMGKAKGAELAIFGTVTHVFKQTFLTLKIIDIETTVILKAIKAKGTLEEPDKLALDAGFAFMKGLSQVLYSRYKIGAARIENSSRKNLREFLKARDLIQQAIIAHQEGDSGKKDKHKKQAEKIFEELEKNDPLFKNAIAEFRENTMWQLEE